MKRNHSLLEYTRDNDTRVSELGPSGPSCFCWVFLCEKKKKKKKNNKKNNSTFWFIIKKKKCLIKSYVSLLIIYVDGCMSLQFGGSL